MGSTLASRYEHVLVNTIIRICIAAAMRPVAAITVAVCSTASCISGGDRFESGRPGWQSRLAHLFIPVTRRCGFTLSGDPVLMAWKIENRAKFRVADLPRGVENSPDQLWLWTHSGVCGWWSAERRRTTDQQTPASRDDDRRILWVHGPLSDVGRRSSPANGPNTLRSRCVAGCCHASWWRYDATLDYVRKRLSTKRAAALRHNVFD